MWDKRGHGFTPVMHIVVHAGDIYALHGVGLVHYYHEVVGLEGVVVIIRQGTWTVIQTPIVNLFISRRYRRANLLDGKNGNFQRSR